jgi:hypothetical protein
MDTFSIVVTVLVVVAVAIRWAWLKVMDYRNARCPRCRTANDYSVKVGDRNSDGEYDYYLRTCNKCRRIWYVKRRGLLNSDQGWSGG